MGITIKRRKTRRIMVGTVPVGGDAPIAVQSMTNTETSDVAATVAQIQRLTEAGCEIIRVAVPDQKAALAIKNIKKEIQIPLIADIHFDHRLAIAAAKSGADALRINPGNIGGKKRLRRVVEVAAEHGISLRVGVNSGSIEKVLLRKFGGPTPQAMVESALNHLAFLEDLDFHEVKVSLKSSSVRDTIEAYRLFSQKADYPLHLGVTEAGTLLPGLIKSAIGIGTLLMGGIGDTLRVSLTSDPLDEVRAAYEILRALDLRHRGPEIISCPTCGRCEIDLFRLVHEVEKALINISASPKVAIMGCVVNGPGEAKEADIGIAGGRGQGILFKKGKVVKKIPEDQLANALIEEIKAMVDDNG
ncbi:MAG TPA: flavodoxin-dependent (E)-4-hydroxy-3-methylbut-2-enyl-diphosphate synthase [Deltaproteobacteria bacterium]|nr:MAG: 4-hydroxy-3-methylbut-2-en-1-yl diphosphate synthase [Deltaproteobacteria bacterium]RLB41211.1 MAG: 4-hydroxy-3-methylbut-2-en-1-yl diphosphate synthase [Deltaproteobacteria bacterium]HDM76138.1 flavodoxin-dependent (E)-4-hydroxy-3-methylbut-2-enyl-diphosphate synthase [Deltaproteobacteria bacterium]